MDSEKRFRLRDLDDRLKKQVGKALAQCRVIQHLPAKISGLKVEQNTWRVVNTKDGIATLHQKIRSDDGTLPEGKETTEKVLKLLGINPDGNGKLAAIKGALVIPENFGAAIIDNAIDEQSKFEIIPFHKVWQRLQQIKKSNKNKLPRVIRNGQIIRIKNHSKAGYWVVRSVKQSLN